MLELANIEKIEFKNLSFRHEGHAPLLNKVSMEFPMEQIVWVKGAEGQGKSTLLQVLAGLEIPQSGEFNINDKNVLKMSFEEFLPYRLSIGYTFDYGGLISNRTVFDNLILPLSYHKLMPHREARTRVDELINYFDIHKFSHERPAHIPGRVRKLTCLLRALAMQPQLLIMDDPSVGLGQETLQMFVTYIHRMRKEGYFKHIFMSSYDQKFMDMFDYKIIRIDSGRLSFPGSVPEKKVVHL